MTSYNEQNEQKKEEKSRMTENVNTPSKTASSTFYIKSNKRYQSAQKYRKQADN